MLIENGNESIRGWLSRKRVGAGRLKQQGSTGMVTGTNRRLAGGSLLLASTLLFAGVLVEHTPLAKLGMVGGSGPSLMTMLAERSPGGRSGAMLNLKPARAASKGAPHERALAKVQPPHAIPQSFVNQLVPAGTATGIVPPVVTETPAVLADAGPLPAVLPGAGGAVFAPDVGPPGGGGGGGGAGGGGTPGTTDTPGTPNTPPVTPAVPEPATWAMMLIGFGLCGRALRRSNRGVVRAMSLNGLAAG